jgi:glycosyltransferase involved in cell wall biosynthesis
VKVAIIHDWMTIPGGGERCVAAFMDMFPGADLFCVVDFLPADARGFLAGRSVFTSFIQRMPGARTRYRSYLALMPLAVEQFDLSSYDLIISSSSSVAKGVITGPDQIHISYTHSPIRYAWDLQHSYLKSAGLTRGIKSTIARSVLHYMRIWDIRTSFSVDHFVANSEFIARRIWKNYRREATIIYPPVDIDRFRVGGDRESFYLTASRMVPYKKMPMIAEAFAAMPDRQLVIIGDGPDMDAVRAASGPNIRVLGRQSDEVVADYMRRAKAFVFAAEEDFGIVPLEAQACGTPVIAFGKGATLETIRGHDGPGQTGLFFQEQSKEALIEAVGRLDLRLPFIDPNNCRANAERFSAHRFRSEIMRFVEAAWAERLADGRTRPAVAASAGSDGASR